MSLAPSPMLGSQMLIKIWEAVCERENERRVDRWRGFCLLGQGSTKDISIEPSGSNMYIFLLCFVSQNTFVYVISLILSLFYILEGSG